MILLFLSISVSQLKVCSSKSIFLKGTQAWNFTTAGLLTTNEIENLTTLSSTLSPTSTTTFVTTERVTTATTIPETTSNLSIMLG